MSGGTSRAMFGTRHSRCEFHIANGVYKANEEAHNGRQEQPLPHMKGGHTMTDAQARKLGAIVSRARSRKGLSLREAAAKVGISYVWLNDLESGRYSDPAPDRLARLAETLGIDPVAIDRVNHDVLANSLPDVRTYFRAKEGLTAQQLDEVEATLQRLRNKHAAESDAHKSNQSQTVKGGTQ